MTFEMVESVNSDAVIKVIGVGGGGGNAVAHMVQSSLEGVDFVCANTDAQALSKIPGVNALPIGQHVTKGLGAGANPEIGRQAALEDKEALKSAIDGADMLFITAGMGGGTGTGAAPVIAQVAKDLGILTVAVITKPFGFEGKKRSGLADEGIKELSQYVDSLITIPNEKLIAVLGAEMTVISAFATANDVLKSAVKGISELITLPGMINVDFADVKTVMSEMGMAMMGSGVAQGENRAMEATHMAISSPLLEDIDLKGANGILVNVVSGFDLTLGELNSIGDMVKEIASDSAQIVFGAGFDSSLENELRVTIVATGLNKPPKQQEQVSVSKAAETISIAPVPVVDGVRDFSQYDSPTFISRSPKTAVGGEPIKEKEHSDEDYLDIPAFLRRQAD